MSFKSFYENENSNEGKKIFPYECPFCHKKYGIPIAMAYCILKCEKEKKIIEENKRKEQLAKEKEMRFNDVKKSWEIIKKETEKINQLEEKLKQDYPNELFDFSSVKPNMEQEINEFAKQITNLFNVLGGFGF